MISQKGTAERVTRQGSQALLDNLRKTERQKSRKPSMAPPRSKSIFEDDEWNQMEAERIIEEAEGSELSSSLKTDKGDPEPIFQFGIRPLSGTSEASTHTLATQDIWALPRDLSCSSSDAVEQGNTWSLSGDPTDQEIHNTLFPVDTVLDDSDSCSEL